MPGPDLPRLYVTGSSGFIGCQLAQYARQRGCAVTATGAANNAVERRRIETLARGGIPVALVSLEDRAALLASLRGQDAIVHLAAAQHEAHAPESYFRRVNVEGTRRLLEAAASAGVRRFVYGSTIGVYGSAGANGASEASGASAASGATGTVDAAGAIGAVGPARPATREPAELDESSPLAPDNPYGRTKATAESVVRAFADALEISIVRISETYGPEDLRLLKLFRAIERHRYVTLGRGTNEHQPIYVDDLCEGLLKATSAPQAVGETFVLAGEERLTTNAMVAMICAAVGRPRLPTHVPLWPFAAAAQVCEVTLKPLGVKAPLNPRRLDFFRKSFRFSTAKARALLDFTPGVPFAEGAHRTAKWYRAEGLLPAAAVAPSSHAAGARHAARPSGRGPKRD